MQRETRERAEQDREERERVRKENIEREDAIRKEALARDESLREESRKEKEENLACIEKSRFRDTVLAGLSSHREGDDLESYMDTLENSFTKVGLPLEEWSFYIRGRLSGSVAKQWVDVCEVVPTYRAARSSLLTAMGYTARKACLTFYDMLPGDIKGMDADAFSGKGQIVV